MEQKGLLLYCIADSFDEALMSIKGLDDIHTLCSLKHKGLYAIFSNVELQEYSEESIKTKSEDINWIKEKACRFMEIMQSINEKTILIPMKFLTLFNREDRIIDIIDENYEDFQASISKLRQREEFNVKLYCNDKIFKETSMGEEMKAFEETLEGKSKGSAFFLKKKFDSELDDKVRDKICRIANSIIEDSNTYYTEMKSLKLLPKEITGIKERMVLNCAFLVDKKEKNNLIGYFVDMKEKHKDSGFLIECSGPWPPYDFC